MTRKRGAGEGAIFQDSNGVWHARVQVGYYASGARKYKEFKGQKKSDVAAKKRQFEATFDKDEAVNDGPYFKDFIMEWLRTVKKIDLKPTSYDRALRTAQQQIIPCIGSHRIGRLTTKMIQDELINALLDNPNEKSGKRNSYSVINKAYIYTNACLKYAVAVKIIPSNPCVGVVRPNKILVPSKPIRFFTDDEMRRFFDALDKSRSKYAWALKFMAYTGLRTGEMLALRKDCVDMVNKQIYVRRTIIKTNWKNGGYACQETTKNGRFRYVGLSANALACMSDAYSKCEEDSNYLVTGSDTILSQDTLREAYLNACKRAKIENPQGMHTLRHTFASKLIRGNGTTNIDIKTVSELLGHASVSFTYNTYVHLIDEQKSKAVEMIDF